MRWVRSPGTRRRVWVTLALTAAAPLAAVLFLALLALGAYGALQAIDLVYRLTH